MLATCFNHNFLHNTLKQYTTEVYFVMLYKASQFHHKKDLFSYMCFSNNFRKHSES